MNYIIVDLEATCWKKKGHFENEIIEIGAVCVDAIGQVCGEYGRFVQPIENPVLSDFCIDLTSIQQKDVDGAAAFPEVLADFLNWIATFGEDYWLCSWGFYDKSQFKKDCERHGLSIDWLEQHISLKHQYKDIHLLRRPIGMVGALRREGISLEGTHHRGIDDARNIAKIFIHNFDYWTFE